MRRRRGGTVLEIALFVPMIVTLLVGMVQIGKITYVYYTLRKTLHTLGALVAAQQGVNFCDEADLTVQAAKNFALSGSSSDDGTDPILPALTTDMVSVTIERLDPASGVPVACDCSVTGCDAGAGGGSPDFVVVSIPDGFQVNPRIPFVTLDPILLRPSVRVPYGGT
jgi:Flp pilus assembly protein TadG